MDSKRLYIVLADSEEPNPNTENSLKLCWSDISLVSMSRMREIGFVLPSFLEANSSETQAPFLDLHLSILDGFISYKIYDKRDDFDFEIVNFPYMDGYLPRRASYGVNISQFIRFARVSSHVSDFNTRNKLLTAKLLNQG